MGKWKERQMLYYILSMFQFLYHTSKQEEKCPTLLLKKSVRHVRNPFSISLSLDIQYRVLKSSRLCMQQQLPGLNKKKKQKLCAVSLCHFPEFDKQSFCRA